MGRNFEVVIHNHTKRIRYVVFSFVWYLTL
jgi:hypothetical protein